MNFKDIPENPYLLLTPGPLSTSKSVKAAMLKDWCTWDDDYNNIVQEIRARLLEVAGVNEQKYTVVLMQGSGTFSIESVVGSVVSQDGKLLVLTNGAYGERIVTIANYLGINVEALDAGEKARPSLEALDQKLATDAIITHVAVVHCETTTGMLNPINGIGKVVKKYGKEYIVDAMSSFGGIPISMDEIQIDYLVSSANKCLQGVPGFGFTIAKRAKLEKTKGIARSLSLDLYGQWETMEKNNGKWRFTSPTHTVRAFRQALDELEEEGGVDTRYLRYYENQKLLVEGMDSLGLAAFLPRELQSPIITTFISPEEDEYDFTRFYNELKSRGFVIYPGKVTDMQCFRIGNIGEVYKDDVEALLKAIEDSMYWKR